MSDELQVQIEQGVGVVTLNRPESLNALHSALIAELGAALQALAADAEVGCVVLTGAGRAFCAGGDLKAIRARDAAAPKAAAGAGLGKRIDGLRQGSAVPRLLHDMGKPTIAMINGPCAGLGMSLAGACDLRFAGASVVMTSAYQKIGLSGDGGGSWYWTQILGSAGARRLFLMNERFEGRAALEFGLVHELWPDAELRARTLDIARRIAEAPPGALRFAKEALNAAEDGSFARVLEFEAVTHALSGASR